MKKVLILISDKTPQKLIMRGFCRGFKANKFYVETQFEKNLTAEFLEKTNPQIILSANAFSAKSEIIKDFLKTHKETKNIAYYTDKKDSTLKFPPRTTVFACDAYINPKFRYLPLAISSRTYNSEFENYKYKITFIGNPNITQRVRIFSYIIKTFGNSLAIFCDKKSFEKSITKIEKYLSKDELVTYKYAYQGFLEDERAISKVINSSYINLNIITKFNSSLNFHTFETLAAGGFLLTNNAWAAHEFFDLARDLETYENADELSDKIKFYIKNADIAQTIALNGKDAIRKGHTFKDRVKVILQYCKI